MRYECHSCLPKQRKLRITRGVDKNQNQKKDQEGGKGKNRLTFGVKLGELEDDGEVQTKVSDVGDVENVGGSVNFRNREF